MTMDDSTLYWFDAGTQAILSCPKTGCGAAPTTLVSQLVSVSDLAFEGGSLYWLASAQVQGVATTSLLTCTPAACTPKTIAQIDGSYPGLLTLAGEAAYWPVQDATFTHGRILTCALSGCAGTPSVLASGMPPTQAVAVTATNLYWSELDSGDTGSIKTCPLGSCGSPTTLVATQDRPFELAIDGTTLWFTDEGARPDDTTGALMAVPLAGGAPTSLAEGQKTAFRLRVTPTAIAWNTLGSAFSGHVAGTVMVLVR
jgi:hypothetical protein